MWEYPVYPINILSQIAEMQHFQCNSEVAFEIFHTKQELVLYKPHFKHNICKS